MVYVHTLDIGIKLARVVDSIHLRKLGNKRRHGEQSSSNSQIVPKTHVGR